MVNDKICKDDYCLFKIYTESPISCSIACKANKLCTGFFYHRSSKRCTASTLAISNKKGTKSTSAITAVQTTALTITSSSVESTNTFLTSEPQKTSTLPPDSLEDIWTEWNSSFYKILSGDGFNILDALCFNTSLKSHLVWIDGFDENEHVTDFMKKQGLTAAYIGFLVNPISEELHYHPISSEPVRFNLPWLKSFKDGKECVLIDSIGQWHSAECFHLNSAICEMEVHP